MTAPDRARSCFPSRNMYLIWKFLFLTAGAGKVDVSNHSSRSLSANDSLPSYAIFMPLFALRTSSIGNYAANTIDKEAYGRHAAMPLYALAVFAPLFT